MLRKKHAYLFPEFAQLCSDSLLVTDAKFILHVLRRTHACKQIKRTHFDANSYFGKKKKVCVIISSLGLICRKKQIEAS